MTDIGRAGMVMKGDYNSASTYETLDAVSYLNGLYVAKQNVPAGTVPTNTTYWQKAIDASSLFAEGVSVTKTGNETYKQVIKRLYNLIDWSKVKEYSTRIFVGKGTGTVVTVNLISRLMVIQWFAGATSTIYIYSGLIFGDASTMDFIDVVTGDKVDVTNNEASANWKLALYY